MAFRKCCQLKECSLEYISTTAPGNFQFFTDMPGGHLAQRISGSLPTTNADKAPATITIPLMDGNGAPIEATLYYPKVTPPPNGALQLRSGVIWMRTIGVYLDGTLGEFFDTLPISIGT